MTKHAPFARVSALALGAVLALSAPALAAVDGVWRCSMIGDIPLGILEISGGGYAFTATDTSWNPIVDTANGNGTLSADGATLTPNDGPLLTEFGVMGTVSGDENSISWNNDAGALMGCKR